MDIYRDWSDDDLDAHRRAILDEQERRANLEAIPGQIKSLTQTFIDGGGDPAKLTVTE